MIFLIILHCFLRLIEKFTFVGKDLSDRYINILTITKRWQINRRVMVAIVSPIYVLFNIIKVILFK